MVRKTNLFIIIFIINFNGNLFSQKVEDSLLERVKEIIYVDTKIPQKNVHSLLIGVIDGDSIHKYQLGYADSPPCLDWERPILLGGMSKLFSLIAFHELLNAKEIGFVNEDSTWISEMFGHRSGLSRIPYFKRGEDEQLPFYEQFSGQDLTLKAKEMKPTVKNYKYSHWGYGVIQHLFEEKTGRLFFDIIRNDSLINPYKVFIFDKKRTNICQGYVNERIKSPFPVFNSCEASLGLAIYPNDLIRFLSDNLNHNSNKSEENLEVLFKDPMPTGIRKSIDKCLGWYRITDKKGNAQFSYAGNIAGHSVSLLFDQNKKKGIIIVADTDELLDQLGFQLLYKL